ncbi:hypothetical protein D3C80_2116780 [compost metagenome]
MQTSALALKNFVLHLRFLTQDRQIGQECSRLLAPLNKQLMLLDYLHLEGFGEYQLRVEVLNELVK